MNRPTWDNFIAVNSGDKQNALEALARMLFKAKYGQKDNLAYFKNHAGNETDVITDCNDVIGFQSKYFDGSINTSILIDSMKKAKEKNPSQTKFIIYTNSAFGNPKGGKTMTNGRKTVEDEAVANNLILEWWFGDNILDAVSRDSLLNDLFFNADIKIRDLQKHVYQSNDLHFAEINNDLTVKGQQYSFNRSEITTEVKSLLQQKKNILIYGESGSGKSAVVKDIYEELKVMPEYAFYIINAAQLNTNAVNDLFQLQEDYTIVNFCRFYDSAEHKVLIIDSAEKLLINDKKLALILLIDELKKKDWTFIFICRQNVQLEVSRMLSGKYQVEVETVKVPSILEKELERFAQTYDFQLPTDAKLKNRLANLFYLARYCELNQPHPSTLTLQSFRDNVWGQKVRGGEYGAKGQYREDCLLKIVNDLVQNNRYYAPKQGIDHDSAYALVQDDVLSDNGMRGYSVKHDIYADWAIDYITDKNFIETNGDLSSFIKKTGEALISVNSFSRWFEAKIAENDVILVRKFASYLFDGGLSSRWQQAVIKGICKSEDFATVFFDDFKKQLIANGYQWLNTFISVMNVSCQEVDKYFIYEGHLYPRLQPVGSGWKSVVTLIDEIQDEYYMNNLKFVFIVLDNYRKLNSKSNNLSQKAALLSLRIFDEIASTSQKKTDNYFWMEKPEPWCELVCDYAVFMSDEIKQLFDGIVVNKWCSHGDPYYELTSYIAKTEYHFHLFGLAVSNMQPLLNLLEAIWFYEKPEEDGGYSSSHHYRESEWSFGLNKDFLYLATYLPVSALQTPILMLLQAEQVIDNQKCSVIDFIIQVVNRSVQTYISRPFANDKPFYVSIGLPDGSKKQVISSFNLWNLYRGSSGLAMPYLMQSIHMALEKYFLDLLKDKGNVELVRLYLHHILEGSESCSLVAIVASVVTAYPELFFEEALLLMQDIRLLEMDMMRSNREITSSALDFAYNDHKNMWEERKQAREMRHRKLQIENLLTNYQITFDTDSSDSKAKDKLNRLYRIVDDLSKQVNSMPVEEQGLLGYTIARIDYRKMKKEDVTLSNGVKAIQIIPGLTKEQIKASEKFQKKSEEMTRGINLRYWVENRAKEDIEKVKNMPFEKDLQLVFDEIKDIKDQLAKHPKGYTLLVGDEFLPAMVCGLLLTQFIDKLTDTQKQTCRDNVVDALSTDGFLMSSPLSGFDICLNAIPRLIELYPQEEETWAGLIISYANIRHETGNYRACDKVRQMVSQGKLWDDHYDFMNSVVDSYRHFADEGENDLSDIDVADTLLCLIPSGTKNVALRQLAVNCMQQLSLLWKPDEDSRISSDNRYFISYQVAHYILFASDEDLVKLTEYFARFLRPDDHYGTLINSFIITCCQYERYNNFWKVWDVFYGVMSKPVPSHYPAQELGNYLLNPNFLRVTSDYWFKFEEKDIQFYRNVAKDIGDHPAVLCAIVKVFSTIAKNHYLEAIPIISSIVVRDNLYLKDTIKVVLFYLEKMTQRIFTEIPEKMKIDNELRENVVKILKFMESNESQIASQFLSSF